MEQFMHMEFLGRGLAEYGISLATLFLGFFAIAIVGVIAKRAHRREEERIAVDAVETTGTETGSRYRFVLRMLQRVVLPGARWGIVYLALRLLHPPETILLILRAILIVLITWYVIRLINTSVDAAFDAYAARRGETGTNRLKPLLSVINLIVWVIALVFLLDNMGMEISTIVTGLGIGGIAIALAAQALLGDLFSYFVIFFDRPFELGDFVIFEDILGTIEQIGIKTTRIRSLAGEQIVVANSLLTGAKLHNYKRMRERRLVFSFGVTYNTGAERLREIPELLRGIIGSEPQARFDRAHFKAYGASSLDFEMVYYVLSPDYTVYMDIQQRINLAIYEALGERGVDFAFPTRTVYLERSE